MMRVNRRLVQTACLLIASILLWPLPFWTGAPRFVSQISPFVALCDSIAIRALGIGTGIGLMLAAIGLVRRRWFCTYACPVGLLLEWAARIGLKKSAWWARLFPLGKYVALLTMGGALAGYPVLLWMDPLAIFSSSFAMRTAGSASAMILAGSGMGILLLLSLSSGGIWCARLCPLGGLMDMLASAKKVVGKRTQALGTPPNPFRAPWPVSSARRSFLFVLAGAGMGLLAGKLGAARGENAPLRPPGAVSESDFAGLCLRCGNCIRACPSSILKQDTGRAGMLGLLAPIVFYTDGYCLEGCNACTQVCPSGAIRPLDLQQKNKYVIGEALVELSLCVLALGRMDCDACMRACSYKAIRINWDEEYYVAYPMVDWKQCNGCGACELSCPAPGERAIRVWKSREEPF